MQFNVLCHCRTCARARGVTPVHLIGVMADQFSIDAGEDMCTTVTDHAGLHALKVLDLLTHSLTHSLARSLTHLLTHSLTRSLTHSLTGEAGVRDVQHVQGHRVPAPAGRALPRGGALRSPSHSHSLRSLSDTHSL